MTQPLITIVTRFGERAHGRASREIRSSYGRILTQNLHPCQAFVGLVRQFRKVGYAPAFLSGSRVFVTADRCCLEAWLAAAVAGRHFSRGPESLLVTPANLQRTISRKHFLPRAAFTR